MDRNRRKMIVVKGGMIRSEIRLKREDREQS